MAILSMELNRLLGSALLEPELLRRVLSAERSLVLQGYKLSTKERSALLASQAHTLTELSRELTATLSTADIADVDAQVDLLMQALPMCSTPAMDVHAYMSRAVDEITSHMVLDSQYEDLYMQRLAS